MRQISLAPLPLPCSHPGSPLARGRLGKNSRPWVQETRRRKHKLPYQGERTQGSTRLGGEYPSEWLGCKQLAEGYRLQDLLVPSLPYVLCVASWDFGCFLMTIDDECHLPGEMHTFVAGWWIYKTVHSAWLSGCADVRATSEYSNQD